MMFSLEWKSSIPERKIPRPVDFIGYSLEIFFAPAQSENI